MDHKEIPAYLQICTVRQMRIIEYTLYCFDATAYRTTPPKAFRATAGRDSAQALRLTH
jgi:hypothetical protein